MFEHELGELREGKDVGVFKFVSPSYYQTITTTDTALDLSSPP